MDRNSRCHSIACILSNEKMLRMYANRDTGGDIEFIIRYADENITSFFAHSEFMKWASPVFDRMLQPAGFTEISHRVLIEDIRPGAFDQFIRFTYLSYVDIQSYEDAWELFAIASKYIFIPLQDFCSDYILSKLNVQNSLNAYSLSSLYGLQSVYLPSRQIIITKTLEVFSEPDFLEIGENDLTSLLDEPNLNIPESKLFEFVEKWLSNQILNSSATDKKSLKKRLCKLIIPKFRFFEMSYDQFLGGPNNSDYLTKGQKSSIIANFKSAKPVKLANGICYIDKRGSRQLTKCDCKAKKWFCCKYNPSPTSATFSPDSYLTLSDSFKLNPGHGFVSFLFTTSTLRGLLISTYYGLSGRFSAVGIKCGFLRFTCNYFYTDRNRYETKDFLIADKRVDDSLPHYFSAIFTQECIIFNLDNVMKVISYPRANLESTIRLGDSPGSENAVGFVGCISSFRLSNKKGRVNFQTDHCEARKIEICGCDLAGHF